VLHYNVTPHESTGFTPRYLHLGLTDIQTTISLENARQLAIERTQSLQTRQKGRHDAKHPKSSFAIGDLVVRKMASNHPALIKTSPRNTGPYRVLTKLGDETYRIALVDNDNIGPPIAVHSSQLRPFVTRVAGEHSTTATDSNQSRHLAGTTTPGE
jgi:hypothetical protein